jgi:hypothetical protein
VIRIFTPGTRLGQDENDGHFDHVPPPVPPPEADDEFYAGLPIGFGFRVPMFVISPWSAGACSQTFDHTSVVRFLETWLDVPEPNIGPWRRRVAGDLRSAFDFETAGRRPGVLPGPHRKLGVPRYGSYTPIDRHTRRAAARVCPLVRRIRAQMGTPFQTTPQCPPFARATAHPGGPNQPYSRVT